MKKLQLLPQFAMLLSEIEFLCGLKPNLPDTELTGVEKRTLGNIYYKYFGTHPELIETEAKIKFPGGEKKKVHECQRAILAILHEINNAAPKNGELLPSNIVMDLSWVMGMLKSAPANFIAILTMATEVSTEVPVIEATHVAVTVNGRATDLNKGQAVRYSDLFAIAYPGKDVVPGLTCTWSSGNDGGSLIYDGEGVEAKAGMHFNIISTGNA